MTGLLYQLRNISITLFFYEGLLIVLFQSSQRSGAAHGSSNLPRKYQPKNDGKM